MTIALWVSLTSVGKVTFLGCTVVSTTTLSRSFVASAPVRCTTDRLSWINAASCSSPSPLAPVGQRGALERQRLLEALLAAEVL